MLNGFVFLFPCCDYVLILNFCLQVVMSKSQIVKEMNEASGSGTQTHLQATVPETQTHLQETPKQVRKLCLNPSQSRTIHTLIFQVSNTASLVTCNSSSDSDEDYDEPYDQNAYRVNVRQNNPPVENFLIQKTSKIFFIFNL